VDETHLDQFLMSLSPELSVYTYQMLQTGLNRNLLPQLIEENCCAVVGPGGLGVVGPGATGVGKAGGGGGVAGVGVGGHPIKKAVTVVGSGSGMGSDGGGGPGGGVGLGGGSHHLHHHGGGGGLGDPGLRHFTEDLIQVWLNASI
jgi:hypothetical protein